MPEAAGVKRRIQQGRLGTSSSGAPDLQQGLAMGIGEQRHDEALDVLGATFISTGKSKKGLCQQR